MGQSDSPESPTIADMSDDDRVIWHYQSVPNRDADGCSLADSITRDSHLSTSAMKSTSAAASRDRESVACNLALPTHPLQTLHHGECFPFPKDRAGENLKSAEATGAGRVSLKVILTGFGTTRSTCPAEAYACRRPSARRASANNRLTTNARPPPLVARPPLLPLLALLEPTLSGRSTLSLKRVSLTCSSMNS